MTPEQFCYWLQGRAELRPDDVPTAEEWQSIREHLATVFHKVTPIRAPDAMPRPPRFFEAVTGDYQPLPATSIC